MTPQLRKIPTHNYYLRDGTINKKQEVSREYQPQQGSSHGVHAEKGQVILSKGQPVESYRLKIEDTSCDHDQSSPATYSRRLGRGKYPIHIKQDLPHLSPEPAIQLPLFGFWERGLC
jgi:hypothetical protein